MERVESGLAFGDHESFYLAGEAGELAFGAKDERLYRKNVNLSEGLEVG